MRVWLAIVSAMAVGGAFAGLAGMVQLTGYEGQIRQGIPAAYGFLGFLASWLSGHHPAWLTLAGIGIAALTVSGDALQVGADLPGASVNILMALLLIGALATSPRLASRGTS
jgi:simple sugar transport system permease protein